MFKPTLSLHKEPQPRAAPQADEPSPTAVGTRWVPLAAALRRDFSPGATRYNSDNATPSNPAIIPTSQKRIVTCVSDQPISSKW
jgi:hypothetical protein